MNSLKIENGLSHFGKFSLVRQLHFHEVILDAPFQKAFHWEGFLWLYVDIVYLTESSKAHL